MAPSAPANRAQSRLILGCMGFGGSWSRTAPDDAVRARGRAAVAAALELGITMFDHADIYCHGWSESVFGQAIRDLGVERGTITIQGKCGIRMAGDPEGTVGRYDFSADHIIAAVEGSLRRLDTGYLDTLLLHRPDPLMEPEEVADAFDRLHAAGKVRRFGVSNHLPGQIALLAATVRQPLVANQVEISLAHPRLLDEGVDANRPGAAGPDGTIESCRRLGIGIQAWRPLARGSIWAVPASGDPGPLAREVLATAERHGVHPSAIALAWLLRHPARIRPVVGTTDPARLRDAARAERVALTREEWYALWTAARGRPVP